MKMVSKALARWRDEHGITGLETAIILIAFVVVAAVFAFVVLSTGLFSSERGKETVYAGLAKTRGTMTLTGAVTATSNGSQLTTITFGAVLAAGGDTVNLDASDTSNRTVIGYIDQSVTDSDMTYVTVELLGDGDLLLEQGELAEVTIDLATECPTCIIGSNKIFTIEVKPPTGSYLVIERLTPPSVAESIINLN